MSLSGRQPSDLGMKGGRLAPPKPKPNNVSSQADSSDRAHYVEPIAFRASTAEAMAAAKRAIETIGRATIAREEPAYLHAEFRSKLLGFVDDLELLHDEKAGVFHVRSGARLGYSDFGVNRGRVEALRALLQARGS